MFVEHTMVINKVRKEQIYGMQILTATNTAN